MGRLSWAPVPGAGTPPPPSPVQEARQPAGNILHALALALAIGGIVIAVAVWVFTSIVSANRGNDIVVTALLVLGFVVGELAIVFALGPGSRPRSRLSIAAFTCGLVGLGVLILWVANTMITF